MRNSAIMPARKGTIAAFALAAARSAVTTASCAADAQRTESCADHAKGAAPAALRARAKHDEELARIALRTR